MNNVSVRADDHGHCVLAGKKANGSQRSNGAAGGGAGKADGLSTRKTVVRFCLCLCLSPSMSSEVRESAAKLDTNMLTKHQCQAAGAGPQASASLVVVSQEDEDSGDEVAV